MGRHQGRGPRGAGPRGRTGQGKDHPVRNVHWATCSPPTTGDGPGYSAASGTWPKGHRKRSQPDRQAGRPVRCLALWVDRDAPPAGKKLWSWSGRSTGSGVDQAGPRPGPGESCERLALRGRQGRTVRSRPIRALRRRLDLWTPGPIRPAPVLNPRTRPNHRLRIPATPARHVRHLHPRLGGPGDHRALTTTVPSEEADHLLGRTNRASSYSRTGPVIASGQHPIHRTQRDELGSDPAKS